MIRNIVFDIGEILMGYRWTYALEVSGLSVEEGNRVGKLIFENPIWDEMDAGNVTLAQAKEMYREAYPADAKSIAFFLDHPELMPIAREDVWAKLKEVRAAGYGIYILSNYGKELFAMHVKDASFWEDVDGAVISYEVHVCKPDARIYHALMDKYGLKPEECLFFDDRPVNVEGAIRCGMQSICIRSKEQLLMEMDQLIAGARG